MTRLSTGIEELDAHLGGGLIPGTMTVVVGSSGIGKTQLGIQFAQAGLAQDGQRGALFDMNARADAQGHADYAKRMFDWTLREEDPERRFEPETFFDADQFLGDYFRALAYRGKRVNRRDLSFDDWHDWQAELSKHLDATIAFFFSHFFRGSRRFVVDGIEPIEHQGESIQFELFEYVYHQIIRKDPEWVARDLFRQHFRSYEQQIRKHLYNQQKIGCMVLYTSPETSLDAMIEKPLDEGDLLAGANTIIYMGKIRTGNKFTRAMYISKHRGSVCSEEIISYEINDHGLKIVS